MSDSVKSPVSAKALIAEALAEQQLFTPVAEFGRREHLGLVRPLPDRAEGQRQPDEGGSEARFSPPAHLYQDLIPLTQPGPGEQYAFTVDLDACSGCKACVSACHSLNGLDDEETWREVGLLFGSTAEGPVIQTITTACHHCLDPACQLGCPVNAYHKDPITGIVRHLDDQCIGCQYCIFKCPYDVPKYSPARGIVRKCDMCHQRLAVGEAPACVQACPTHAIRITKVSRAEVETQSLKPLVPGAADSGYTKPTTRYLRETPLPSDLETPPERAIRREHVHWPLVAMLSLTQWSVGCFVVLFMRSLWSMWTNGSSSGSIDLVDLSSIASATEEVLPFFVTGLLTVLAGIGASLFHLGRPLHAWKAFLGFRTSWLSREIVVFGAYAFACLAWSIWLLPAHLAPFLSPLRGFALAALVVLGIGALYCSIMVYVDTRRAFWRWSLTAPKFAGTTLLLGLGTGFLFSDRDQIVTVALLTVSLFKLAFEAGFLVVHARNNDRSPNKRSVLVVTRACSRTLAWRFIFGVVGGIIIPVLALGFALPLSIKVIALGLCLVGEILERVLFFEAVIPERMPGID
jgi:Fe-S-cluster-containing dehydrogenase component/DMSO reductase anchor subunit